MSQQDDDFLSRWSRRKRAAEAPLQEAPALQDAVPPPPEPEVAPLADEELAALPRIEDLTEGSDIRAFLRPGVPTALQSAALRRMWMLTPAIRDYRDPAVDYAWDWNVPGGVPGGGPGPSPERATQMLRDLFEPAKSRESAAAPPVVEAPPRPVADPAPVSEAHSTGELDSQAPDQTPGEKGEGTPLSAEVPHKRRHGSALPT